MADLSDFHHRSSYDDLSAGRDRYIVAAVGRWLKAAVREHCRGGDVLDVGCGEQPLRGLIETTGARYVGMDAVQNAGGTVSIVTPIDGELPAPWPDSVAEYDLLVCSEVLEHVQDWPRAFANLRRLTKVNGRVIVTVPFVFPLHMEPYDYYRGTPHIIDALACGSGFTVVALARLGTALDVISTVTADVSILPTGNGVWSRVKTRLARAAMRTCLAWLSSTRSWRGLQVNSNTYLSNGVVLSRSDVEHGTIDVARE